MAHVHMAIGQVIKQMLVKKMCMFIVTFMPAMLALQDTTTSQNQIPKLLFMPGVYPDSSLNEPNAKPKTQKSISLIIVSGLETNIKMTI